MARIVELLGVEFDFSPFEDEKASSSGFARIEWLARHLQSCKKARLDSHFDAWMFASPEPKGVAYEVTPNAHLTRTAGGWLAHAEKNPQPAGWVSVEGVRVSRHVTDDRAPQPWSPRDGYRRTFRIDARTTPLYFDEDSAEASPEARADDVATLGWLHRDDLEAWQERRLNRPDAADEWLDANDPERQSASKRRYRVIGGGYPTGFSGEFEWLNEVLGQLRADYLTLLRDAMAKTGASASKARGFRQLQAVERRARSLRHRYNFRRYVEALGGDPAEAEIDPQDVAEAWRRDKGLTYEAAAARLAQRVESINRPYGTLVGVEGLIAA